MRSFGMELRRTRLRAPRNNQLADLARSAGVSRRAIEMAEHGDVVPKVETVERIIAALGLPASDAMALRNQRNAEQARRQGLSTVATSGDFIPALVNQLAAEAIGVLRQGGADVNRDIARGLRARFLRVLRRELSPGVSHDEGTPN